MHRSRPLVLAILAALAACSTHDDSKGTELLSTDSTLVARLGDDRSARPLPLPDVCGAIASAARPAAANQQQARELIRQAQSAEMHGDVSEARSLLRRASDLDGTNKSAAYHLGRASEALGDSAAAVTAYCRYLALSPSTAESNEARQRLTTLAPAVTRVSAGSVADSTAKRGAPVSTSRASVVNAPATRGAPRASAPRPVASAARAREEAAAPRQNGARAARPAERVAPDSSSQGSGPGATPAEAGSVATAGASSGDVATAGPESAAEQPSSPSRTARRGPSRTQGAIIGAATGAIIGAATGRSVKGAVIGAAAGGVLGGVVVGRSGPVGTGTWARRMHE